MAAVAGDDHSSDSGNPDTRDPIPEVNRSPTPSDTGNDEEPEEENIEDRVATEIYENVSVNSQDTVDEVVVDPIAPPPHTVPSAPSNLQMLMNIEDDDAEPTPPRVSFVPQPRSSASASSSVPLVSYGTARKRGARSTPKCYAPLPPLTIIPNFKLMFKPLGSVDYDEIDMVDWDRETTSMKELKLWLRGKYMVNIGEIDMHIPNSTLPLSHKETLASIGLNRGGMLMAEQVIDTGVAGGGARDRVPHGLHVRRRPARR